MYTQLNPSFSMFGGFLEEKSRLRNVRKSHVTVLKLSTEFRYKIAEDKVKRKVRLMQTKIVCGKMSENYFRFT